MLLADYDIVFQEVPNETTLALNISDCPHHCPGCHSSHLWEPIGDPLTRDMLSALLERYPYITCVSIQGGDKNYHEVMQVIQWVKEHGFKTCWYTGYAKLPEDIRLTYFDYIKTGPYIQELGGLKSKNTNQRFYRVEHLSDDEHSPHVQLHDITNVFWK